MKNCEKNYDDGTETTVRLMNKQENLQSLLEQVSLLETRVTKMIVQLGNFNIVMEEFGTETHSPSKILQFPGVNRLKPDTLPVLKPYMAKPGSPLPKDIPDFRPALQRDGLILLAWDKRITETGERYSAYWVTSAGIPRFYASKPLSAKDFSSATPHHKSYAAEDGIEFYGQDAPAYIVHVAPELMMSNPMHNELRLAHIALLICQGSNINFDYKYLLKNNKKRNLPSTKPKGSTLRKTGA